MLHTSMFDIYMMHLIFATAVHFHVHWFCILSCSLMMITIFRVIFIEMYMYSNWLHYKDGVVSLSFAKKLRSLGAPLFLSVFSMFLYCDIVPCHNLMIEGKSINRIWLCDLLLISLHFLQALNNCIFSSLLSLLYLSVSWDVCCIIFGIRPVCK